MKSFPFFLAAIIFTLSLNAQKTEPLIEKIYYQYIHHYDKKDTSKKFYTDVLLLAGNSNSRFSKASNNFTDPLPDFILNPPVKPDISKMDIEDYGVKLLININSKAIEERKYFRIPKDNKIVFIGTIGFNDFRVEIPTPEINWKIEDKFREIGGIQCQKAIGDFSGRKYIAWFAPSIPFPYGPWKLGGLPGIILEVADSKNEVQFIFKERSKVGNEFLYFEEFNPTKLSEQAYLKLKEKYQKDPVAFAKSQMDKNDTVSGIFFFEENGNRLKGADAIEAIKRESTIKITNPVELK